MVTGGARGIGEAICRSFAAEGAKVLLVDRDAEAGAALAAEIDAEFHQLDLTDHPACDALMTGLDRLDVLIHNAGVNDAVGLDRPLADFHASLSKNLDHVFLLTSLARPLLVASQGAVVCISSKVSLTGQRGTSGYAAAKGAMNALVREWAADLAPQGVRVNAVLPAEVMTPMYEAGIAARPDGEAFAAGMARLVPLGNRFTTPAEIADTVVFLASGRSSHTTGQLLFVDGGYTHLDRAISGLPSA